MMNAFIKIGEGTIERIKSEKIQALILLWPIVFIAFSNLYYYQIFAWLRDNIFIYFERSLVLDIFLILTTACVLAIQFFTLKNKRVVKIHYYEIHFLWIAALVLIYRFQYNYYLEYRIFHFIPYFFLLASCIIMAFGIKLYFFVKTVNQEFSFLKEKTVFDLDNPIESKDNGKDILKREKFAKEIVEEIYSVELNVALAISITGGWGTGKSSLMKLIRNEIEEKNKIISQSPDNKNVNLPIVIDFNPWLYSHKEDIVVKFFETLKVNLNYLGSEIPELIGQYSEEISDAEEGFLGTTFSKPFLPKNQTLIKNTLEKIESVLKSIKTNIIIFIDDIDRLENQQIIDIFKVIRLTANLPNIVFIASFDKEYINQALVNNDSASDYYEKIFQVDFPLPEISESIISHELNEVLDELHKVLIKRYEELNLVGLNHFNLETKKEISALLRMNYLKFYFSDLRDIKRFKNQLLFNVRFLEHEVSLLSFVGIHLLRLKFPDIYSSLHKYKSQMLSSLNNKLAWSSENGKPLGLTTAPNNIKHHAVNELLSIIFSETTSNTNSIIYNSNFERYFTLEKSGITNERYKSFFSLAEEEFNTIILENTKDKELAFHLLEKIKVHVSDIKSPSDIYRIVSAFNICQKQVGTENPFYSKVIIPLFENNIKYSDDLKNAFEGLFSSIKEVEAAIELYQELSLIKEVYAIIPKDLTGFKVFKEFNFANFFRRPNYWKCTFTHIENESIGDENFIIRENGDILYVLQPQDTIRHKIIVSECFTNGLNLNIVKHVRNPNGTFSIHSAEELLFESTKKLIGQDFINGKPSYKIEYQYLGN